MLLLSLGGNRETLAPVPVAGFVNSIAPVYPRTTVTMFAGRLDAAGLSFIERGITSLLKIPTGDFRDWDAIAAWTRELPGKTGIRLEG